MTSQLRKIADEKLLAEAVRDWRAGRAHLTKNGKNYKLRGNGSPTWGKVVKKLLGTERNPSGSDALHKLGEETYGSREAPTEFESLHGLDRVRSRLLSEIFEGKPAMAPGTRKG